MGELFQSKILQRHFLASVIACDWSYPLRNLLAWGTKVVVYVWSKCSRELFDPLP